MQDLVDGLTRTPDVALARVWLIQANSACEVCRGRADGRGSDVGLHLAASGGRSRKSGVAEVWNRLDGVSHRFPLHQQKIGRIGATGEPLIVQRAADEPALTNPAWVAEEGIESFFGYPLMHLGQVLGVLAVFTRRELDERDVGYLSQIADGGASLVAAATTIAEQREIVERLQVEAASLRRDRESEAFFGPMIARSVAARKWEGQIQLAAGHEQPVLITGEPGAGKEFTARLIHARSPRAREGFVKVDAEVDAEAIGAWLATAESAPGRDWWLSREERDSLALGGMLFLDGVERLPVPLQGRLAAWVQRCSWASRPDEADRGSVPRLIAAGCGDLSAKVQAGQLREDLYCALSVVEIPVPPLRNRGDDFPELTRTILNQIAGRDHVPCPELDASSLERLRRHEWPRNVRQLRHVLEEVVWRSTEGGFPVDRFVPPASNDAQSLLSAAQLKKQERTNMLACLKQCDWRIYGPNGAAELLGMKPTTLAYRMKALGIRKPAR